MGYGAEDKMNWLKNNFIVRFFVGRREQKRWDDPVDADMFNFAAQLEQEDAQQRESDRMVWGQLVKELEEEFPFLCDIDDHLRETVFWYKESIWNRNL
jgi:hypothetical protein